MRKRGVPCGVGSWSRGRHVCRSHGGISPRRAALDVLRGAPCPVPLAVMPHPPYPRRGTPTQRLSSCARPAAPALHTLRPIPRTLRCPAPALQPSSQYAFPATRFLDMLLPCSAGKCRELGRRLDYWMIASSSALLTRALYPGLPAVATALSLASTPFKPFLVTTGNAMAMEGKFLHRALHNPGEVHGTSCRGELVLGGFTLAWVVLPADRQAADGIPRLAAVWGAR